MHGVALFISECDEENRTICDTFTKGRVECRATHKPEGGLRLDSSPYLHEALHRKRDSSIVAEQGIGDTGKHNARTYARVIVRTLSKRSQRADFSLVQGEGSKLELGTFGKTDQARRKHGASRACGF